MESNHSKDANWWSNNLNSRSIESWMGNSFELVCMKHHAQIKEALGIRGMSTEISTWQILPNETDSTQGAQIDMIIERADRIIHLCEMKFSQGEYELTEKYDLELRNKMGSFQAKTKTRKGVSLVMITSYGLKQNAWANGINAQLTMDNLFHA